MKLMLVDVPKREEYDKIIEYDPAANRAGYSYFDAFSEQARVSAAATPESNSAAHWKWRDKEFYVPIHPFMRSQFDVSRMAEYFISIAQDQDHLLLTSYPARAKEFEDHITLSLQAAEDFYNSFEKPVHDLANVLVSANQPNSPIVFAPT